MQLMRKERQCTLSLESGHSTEGSPDLALGGASSRPGSGHGPSTGPQYNIQYTIYTKLLHNDFKTEQNVLKSICTNEM